jgi:curli biogenesis system outer membrane secretion channel CsgG
MLRKSIIVFSILCAAILIGCGKTETSNTAGDNSNKAATTGGSSTTASAGDKIGIPECDDFLAKYEACVTGKVPEQARAAYQTGIKQWRDSWKQLAANPQTRGTLAATCKQAREQQETALKSYGCTW